MKKREPNILLMHIAGLLILSLGCYLGQLWFEIAWWKILMVIGLFQWSNNIDLRIKDLRREERG